MQFIGTAGWSLPPNTAMAEGSRLERYSRTLPCVEINSTFYRPHRATTWRRWAAETPEAFRFSIKAPRTITHDAMLRNVAPLVSKFLNQIEPLAEKAGPLLFQLPPSLEFDASVAEDFLVQLRYLYPGEVALEPRHASWFHDAANDVLKRHRIARVAADPPKGAPAAARPGGDFSLVYYRLHGSPRTYYSNYDDDALSSLHKEVSAYNNAWIIFDNTALSHAYANALRLKVLQENGELRTAF